jgi:hypothetical protein
MKLSGTCLTALCVAILASSTIAFGWGPIAHGKAAYQALSHSSITPYLTQYGLSATTIADMAWELDLPEYKDEYHNPGWEAIRDRQWLTDPKWDELDETRRLAFLCHLACDSGVPVNHSPSGSVYTNSLVEALLEATVEFWGDFPTITPYTGTYSQKMDAFYSQQMALANWAKNNLRWWNVPFSQGDHAGWYGLVYGQNLCQAMLLEYFQTRDGLMGMSVPEPATMALLAVGAAVVIRRRRRA